MHAPHQTVERGNMFRCGRRMPGVLGMTSGRVRAKSPGEIHRPGLPDHSS